MRPSEFQLKDHSKTKDLNRQEIIKQKESLTFPKASKPLSKKRIAPRNEKKMPNPMRPKPTSAILLCHNDKFRSKCRHRAQNEN